MRRSRSFIGTPKAVAADDPPLLSSPLLGIASQTGPPGSGGLRPSGEKAGRDSPPPRRGPQDGGRFQKRTSPTAGPRPPDGDGVRRSGAPRCPAPGEDCPPDGDLRRLPDRDPPGGTRACAAS